MVKNILPVLPLRDIVVFPNMVAPLFVGREQSVNALNHVMTGDKKIFLLSQKNSKVDNPNKENLYPGEYIKDIAKDILNENKELNLNDFDKTHLEQKLTLEEAIRFENRIGFGAPYDRVKRYIGKTRKEAIDLVINELENYQDNFEWPSWKDNYIPTSFIEQGLKRSKRDCRKGNRFT